jgi:peptidoglycan/LPS O-acetylase OafA/YrhL
MATMTTTTTTTTRTSARPVIADRLARTRCGARCAVVTRARTGQTLTRVVSRARASFGARDRATRAKGGAGTPTAPREGRRGLVVVAGSTDAEAAPTAKKPRLPALDSIRFFLIAYIGVGHFIACATRETLTLAALSQVNVVVGAFFVLSGYVAAYTTTELGRYEAQMKRLRPSPKYFISRVMGFYPLYFVVNALFAPMFFYADAFYNGPVAAAAHGLMTFTLTQSWFPMHAELWNAPSWFLSAFVFCLAALPFALPPIAAFKRKHVNAAFKVLVIVSLLAKLAYSYDLNAWGFMEGVMTAKTHPNWLYFNSVRFSPFNALVDVLMGAVAARSVMIDGAEDESTPKANAILACSATPLVAMIGFLAARALGVIAINDALSRTVFAVLFSMFAVNVHRETVREGGEGSTISRALSWKPLVYLGTISFPIYILHGPIGQVFYKRVVATKLFGTVFTKYPQFFPAYLLIVLVSAAVVHEIFIKNKKVQEVSKAITERATDALVV